MAIEKADTANKNPILIDFDLLATDKKAALKKLIGVFASNGSTVVSAEADQKLKRTGDYTYRQVHLGFPDSQQVTFGVTKNGDIYQVKINNKLFAVHNQHDQVESVKEIIAALNRGRANWQRKLKMIKEPAPSKKVTMSLKQRAIDAQARLSTAQSAIAEAEDQEQALKDQLATLTANQASVQSEIDDLQNQITNATGNAA